MATMPRGLLSLGAILAWAAVFGLSSCVSSRKAKIGGAGLRQRTLIDADWRFHRGEVTASNQVISASYDAEASWERVQLPHDYQLDGKYEPEARPGGKVTDSRRRGYLPVEVGWYRKHFVIPGSDQGKILQLEFGGVFRDARVWLNGQFLGSHAGGYTGFHFDITKAARYGADKFAGGAG